MPFKEEMSWEPGKKRWAKMYKRQRYFVVASALGPVHTRDATRAAANDWWLKKKAELDGFTELHPIEVYVDSVLDGPPDDESAEAHELIDEAMSGIIGVQSHKRLVEAVQHGLSRTATLPERSVKAVAELPKSVAPALWTSLLDGSGMSMLSRPTGPRWTFQLAPGEAGIWTIEK